MTTMAMSLFRVICEQRQKTRPPDSGYARLAEEKRPAGTCGVASRLQLRAWESLSPPFRHHLTSLATPGSWLMKKFVDKWGYGDPARPDSVWVEFLFVPRVSWIKVSGLTSSQEHAKPCSRRSPRLPFPVSLSAPYLNPRRNRRELAPPSWGG